MGKIKNSARNSFSLVVLKKTKSFWQQLHKSYMSRIYRSQAGKDKNHSLRGYRNLQISRSLEILFQNNNSRQLQLHSSPSRRRPGTDLTPIAHLLPSSPPAEPPGPPAPPLPRERPRIPTPAPRWGRHRRPGDPGGLRPPPAL